MGVSFGIMSYGARYAALPLVLFASCKKEEPKQAPNEGVMFIQKNVVLKESINWPVVGEWSPRAGAAKNTGNIAGIVPTRLILRRDGTATIVGSGGRNAEWGAPTEETLHIWFSDGKSYKYHYHVTSDALTIIGDSGPIEFSREPTSDASAY
jgi:hypothetical protein